MYVATAAGTEQSLAACIITHGTLTKPKIPLKSLLKTVRDTNSDMSGLMLNKFNNGGRFMSCYLGEAPMRMSLEKRRGRRIEASIPIMAEIEWPT
ncbi:hypothetical protein Lal_00045488 [Lupinus albus]|nr:hypothetical protein Lal_00045488 [Lupinus albus]